MKMKTRPVSRSEVPVKTNVRQALDHDGVSQMDHFFQYSRARGPKGPESLKEVVPGLAAQKLLAGSKRPPRESQEELSEALGSETFLYRAKRRREKLARLKETEQETEEKEEKEAEEKRKLELAQEHLTTIAHETPEEKKVRLAKQYLEALDGTEGEISKRLRAEAKEATGKFKIPLASKISLKSLFIFRGPKSPVTTAVVSSDGTTIFSATKDGTIFKWNSDGEIICSFSPLRRKAKTKSTMLPVSVLSLALSEDGKYLAAGASDNLIHMYDGENAKTLESFSGHRDAVTGVVFREKTHQLYSVSLDRSLKIWNVDAMAYVDSLFGHQSGVLCVDALSRERALTGSYDKSVRVWKVVEETQLIFSSHKETVDCVCLLNEASFVSGGQDGTLKLWFGGKKTPVYTRGNAHGGKWISALGCCRRSDVVASGSYDGFIRLWRVGSNRRASSGINKLRKKFGEEGAMQLSPLLDIPVTGFVNSIGFSADGSILVASIAPEHKLGRWEVVPNAKNGIVVAHLL
ncbi:U3 small nucleolar RNA-interacting protein 2 [Pelomyxa schiedti]|nr:U3 small nucleolar RNA-interacting protein 2 [Pelomyxa schiedti]